MHDVLLFYSRGGGGDHTFNTLYGYESLAESTLKTYGAKSRRPRSTLAWSIRPSMPSLPWSDAKRTLVPMACRSEFLTAAR